MRSSSFRNQASDSQGRTNIRAMREAYPAQVAITTHRIRGGGKLWIAEHVITYDGGNPLNVVSVFEFRGDKVAHETIYFADPWEPPAWRAQWVEPVIGDTRQT